MHQLAEEGLATEWLENGQKKVEADFVDGRPHGPSSGWHDNSMNDHERR